MPAHRIALGLATLGLLSACGDGPPLPNEPSDPLAAQFSARELLGSLDEMVRDASSDFPAGGQIRSEPGDPLTFNSHGGIIALITEQPNPESQAVAATYPYPAGPCRDIRRGAYRWVHVWEQYEIDAIDAALLAGDPVEVVFGTEHYRSNVAETVGAYAERVRIRHGSVATRVLTVLATDGFSEIPITDAEGVHHRLEWRLPITSVAGWAAGDVLVIEAFGIVGALDDNGCDATNSSTTTWRLDYDPQVEN